MPAAAAVRKNSRRSMVRDSEGMGWVRGVRACRGAGCGDGSGGNRVETRACRRQARGICSACRVATARFATRCRDDRNVCTARPQSGRTTRFGRCATGATPPCPRTRAPRVDAASAGASITTLPLGSRRTWSWEKNCADLARRRHGGHRPRSSASGVARNGGATASRLERRLPRPPRHGSPSRRCDGEVGLVARLVGGLDQLVERIGDLVVEIGVGRRPASSSATVAASPRRPRAPPARSSFWTLRQEARRLAELDRVAVAVEEALEERLLRADQGGDPRFDALLADEVVDVDRQLLAEAVDAADPLFEHGRVPGELEVDHAVGGVLEVEPDAAGVAGEEDAKGGVVVELDDVLGPPPLAFGTGEEAGAEAAARRAGR